MRNPPEPGGSDRDAGADFRSRLKADPSLLGLIVKPPATATVELAGYGGFDFALIDAEHGTGDMLELEHHIRAAEVSGLSALVRVSGADSPDILRALDAGAEGIVVPHVRDASDVWRASRAILYPPDGERSLAVSTRAGRQSTRSLAEHVALTRGRVALIAQIEDAEALPEAEAIIAQSDLDAIFIGSADLSSSLGHPGEIEHPVVAAAIDRITGLVDAEAGVALCALASDGTEARRWMERGAKAVLLAAPALLAAKIAEVRREATA